MLINDRTSIDTRATHVVFQPGDLTNYEFLVIPIAGLPVPGTRGLKYAQVVMLSCGEAHHQFKCGPDAEPLSVDYVGSKLNLRGPSAVAMTVALCRELDREPHGVMEDWMDDEPHIEKYRAAWESWQNE